MTLPASAVASYVEVDGGGDTGYSDYGSLGRYTVAVEACGGTPPASTVPSAPVDAGAVPLGGQRAVELSWTPLASGAATVTGYVVQRPGLPDATLAATARTYLLTGLRGDTDYPYAVLAVNAQGSSVPAARVAHTPVYPPSAPRSLVLSAGQPGQVRLAWTAPLDQGGGPFTGYEVKLTPLDPAGAPRAADRVGTSEGTSRSVGGLVEGRRYRLTVWALYDDGAGDPHVHNGPGGPRLRVPGARPRHREHRGVRRPAPAHRDRSGRPGRRTGHRHGPVVGGQERWRPGHGLQGRRPADRPHRCRRSRTGFTAAATARSKVVRLPRGRRFTVAAVNRVGTGRASARSGLVAAR